MSMRIKSDKDNGFNALFAGLKAFNGSEIQVGVVGDDATPEDVALATIHEFGAPAAGVPSRSFLRSTTDENKAKYERMMEASVQRLVKSPQNTNPKRELENIGKKIAKDVRAKIDSGIPPALQDVTLNEKARLGFPSTALIRTGGLQNSITSKVVRE